MVQCGAESLQTPEMCGQPAHVAAPRTPHALHAQIAPCAAGASSRLLATLLASGPHHMQARLQRLDAGECRPAASPADCLAWCLHCAEHGIWTACPGFGLPLLAPGPHGTHVRPQNTGGGPSVGLHGCPNGAQCSRPLSPSLQARITCRHTPANKCWQVPTCPSPADRLAWCPDPAPRGACFPQAPSCPCWPLVPPG